MTRRKKKGEFLLVCALGGLILGAGTMFMAFDTGSRMNALRQHGVVAEALITDMESREERSTEVIGGGRRVSRHSTDYSLSLKFDKNAATLHRDFLAGRQPESRGTPLPYPANIDVSKSVFDAHDEGDLIMITFLPDIASYDKDSFQLTETVEEQSSFGFLIWWYLGAAACLVFGFWGIFRYRAINGVNE